LCAKTLEEIKKRAREEERLQVQKEIELKYLTHISQLDLELEIRKQRIEQLEKEKREKEEFIEGMARESSITYNDCTFQKLDIGVVSEFCKRNITDTVRALQSKCVSTRDIHDNMQGILVSKIESDSNITERDKEIILSHLSTGELNGELEKHLQLELSNRSDFDS